MKQLKKDIPSCLMEKNKITITKVPGWVVIVSFFNEERKIRDEFKSYEEAINGLSKYKTYEDVERITIKPGIIYVTK